MNNSGARIIIIVLFLLLVGIVIYFYSFHSGYSISSITTATTSSQTASSSSSAVVVQTQGSGSLTLTTTNPGEAYATYSLKDPNRLPITQYPKAYGIELDFIASGTPLPSNLCLKVASNVPIKAFSIPGHTDASTTIPTTMYGGAFEGLACFSGGITSEEDTTVFFNKEPSEINASLSTSEVL